MFVRQERLRKRPFGWAKQAHMHTPRRFSPVGQPPLLTFQDYTTAINFLLELRENNAIPSLLNTISKYARTYDRGVANCTVWQHINQKCGLIYHSCYTILFICNIFNN
jgi:hypothetical protein